MENCHDILLVLIYPHIQLNRNEENFIREKHYILKPLYKDLQIPPVTKLHFVKKN